MLKLIWISFYGIYYIKRKVSRDNGTYSSFNSQISQVFKHPQKENLYIALADRWVPEYKMTKERQEWLYGIIAAHYHKKIKVGLSDLIKLMRIPLMGSANTSIAEYVWLPVRFADDKVIIDWVKEWSIEDWA